MMGRQEAPAQLFYEFDLERHVPANHMLREIDLFLDCGGLREALRPSTATLAAHPSTPNSSSGCW